MKLSMDDGNGKKEIKRGWTITRMITWVILFCAFIVLFVIAMNNKEKILGNNFNNPDNSIHEQTKLDGKTSEELQIWDLDEESKEIIIETETTPEPTSLPSVNPLEVPAGFFRITLANGETETHKINSYIPENTLDFNRFSFSGKESYYQFEDESKSFIGIKVSKENGYIDFNKVSKDDIDFVMISAGNRGYGTGQIVLDDYALKHIKNATDAKMDIGIYFKSQAITEEEAIEEANMVLELIDGYMITYPIAFEMERIHSDEGRTENLTKIERTKIANAFLSVIKEAGYDTCIYGDPEFLINACDLSQLKLYDVWLNQEATIPEIPYKFSMWEFSDNEKVDGVSGNVKLVISLIDFQAK